MSSDAGDLNMPKRSCEVLTLSENVKVLNIFLFKKGKKNQMGFMEYIKVNRNLGSIQTI